MGGRRGQYLGQLLTCVNSYLKVRNMRRIIAEHYSTMSNYDLLQESARAIMLAQESIDEEIPLPYEISPSNWANGNVFGKKSNSRHGSVSMGFPGVGFR